MKSVILVLFTGLGFILLDLFLTLVFFGFYTPSFKFDTGLIPQHALLKNGYDFITSGFDFFAVAGIRSILLAFGLIRFFKQATPKFTLVFTGFELTNISYSFTKLLAFSEISEQLKFPGIWFSLVWNEVAWLIALAIWIFLYRSEEIREDVGHLGINTIDEDAERLITDSDETRTTHESANANTGSDKKPQLRISTLKHVKRLLAYCHHHGRWFIAGFFFLVFYSFARVFQPHYTAQVITNIVHMKSLKDLLNSVLIMSGLCLVVTISGGLRGGCFDYATALINRKMRGDLFRSIMQQEIAFFDETKTGEVVSRLTSDCQTMSSTVSTNVNVFMKTESC